MGRGIGVQGSYKASCSIRETRLRPNGSGNAHLCPSLPTVTSARATCFSAGQTPQPCTMHGRIPFCIHAGARACAHKFAFSIVTYLGLRTSGSSSRLFTLPSRKLLVHDYIFFLLSLSLPPRNTPPKSKSLYVSSRKFSGENFSLDFFQKIDGCRIIEIHTDISSRISSFFSSTGMINGIGREREKGFVFVKNLSLEETSSKLFYFFFFHSYP